MHKCCQIHCCLWKFYVYDYISFISLSNTVLGPCKYELTNCAIAFIVVRLNKELCLLTALVCNLVPNTQKRLFVYILSELSLSVFYLLWKLWWVGIQTSIKIKYPYISWGGIVRWGTYYILSGKLSWCLKPKGYLRVERKNLWLSIFQTCPYVKMYFNYFLIMPKRIF